jgi:ATP-binding cassette subfamily B protein
VIEIFHREAKTAAIDPLLISMVCLILYTYVSGVIFGFVDIKLEMRLMETMETAIEEKRSKLEYRLIEHNATWDFISRISGDSSVRMKKGFLNLLTTGSILVRVVSLLILIVSQVWWTAVWMVILFIPLILVSIKSGKTNYDAFKEAKKYERKADYLRSVLQGRECSEERSLFGYVKLINQKWLNAYEASRTIEKRALMINTIRTNISGIVTIAVSIFLVASLLEPLGNGALSIGMFISLVPAIFNFIRIMSKEFTSVTIDLSNDYESMKDMIQFAKLPETGGALDLPDPKIRKQEAFKIEFRNVSFQYEGTNHYVLKNLSMEMYPHLHYAFVGSNGAGKSTITKLLTGLYTDYSGEILIGGRNINEYTTSELKGLFSIVYQDYAKYAIYLKDSIMLGNVHNRSDTAKLKDVIERMDLIRAVSRLPQGINTPVGKHLEGGVDLSGGEWQRVAMARTLVNDAPILILDEPTSALDPLAESNIYDLFHKISRGRSAIFITHRLGAARLADEILVIEDGKVAEQGTHIDLMKREGIYANMYEKQRSWYR